MNSEINNALTYSVPNDILDLASHLYSIVQRSNKRMGKGFRILHSPKTEQICIALAARRVQSSDYGLSSAISMIPYYGYLAQQQEKEHLPIGSSTIAQFRRSKGDVLSRTKRVEKCSPLTEFIAGLIASEAGNYPCVVHALVHMASQIGYSPDDAIGKAIQIPRNISKSLLQTNNTEHSYSKLLFYVLESTSLEIKRAAPKLWLDASRLTGDVARTRASKKYTTFPHKEILEPSSQSSTVSPTKHFVPGLNQFTASTSIPSFRKEDFLDKYTTLEYGDDSVGTGVKCTPQKCSSSNWENNSPYKDFNDSPSPVRKQTFDTVPRALYNDIELSSIPWFSNTFKSFSKA